MYLQAKMSEPVLLQHQHDDRNSRISWGVFLLLLKIRSFLCFSLHFGAEESRILSTSEMKRVLIEHQTCNHSKIKGAGSGGHQQLSSDRERTKER